MNSLQEMSCYPGCDITLKLETITTCCCLLSAQANGLFCKQQQSLLSKWVLGAQIYKPMFPARCGNPGNWKTANPTTGRYGVIAY